MFSIHVSSFLCTSCLFSLLLRSAVAGTFKDLLFDEGEKRLNTFSKPAMDQSYSSAGVNVFLSKETKSCGGDGIPLTFVDAVIEGVRPVDVFNVLADVGNIPKWDKSCSQAVQLGEFRQRGAVGWLSKFVEGPLSAREFAQWMMVEANFTAQTFGVLFTTIENDDLYQIHPHDPANTEAQSCLSYSRVMPHEKGTLLQVTTETNVHSWPITQQDIFDKGGATGLVDWIGEMGRAATAYAGLNDTIVVVPSWMWEKQACTSDKRDTETKDAILAKAAAEFNRADVTKVEDVTLASGETLSLQSRWASCGGHGLAEQSVPLWHADLEVDGVRPIEVFNALAGITHFPNWEPMIPRVETFNISRGDARGLHLQVRLPNSGYGKYLYARDLWSLQVLEHNCSDDSYLVALSATTPTSVFEDTDVRGEQCLTAFKISPIGKDKIRISMIHHVNWGLLRIGSYFMLTSIGKEELTVLSEALVKEAKRLASNRGDSGKLGPGSIDAGTTALLVSPQPPSVTNLTIRQLLQEPVQDMLLQMFVQFDINAALARRKQDTFETAAKDIHHLLQKLRKNATACELSKFSNGPAKDELDLQLHAEALSAIQWRVNGRLQEGECNAVLPDIDKPEAPADTRMLTLAATGVCSTILLCVACICACCCRRKRQITEARRLMEADLGTSMCEAPAA